MAGTDPVGKRIVGVREMGANEMEQQGWDDSPYAAIVLELEDGSMLFASRDDEGNGPGTMFGRSKDGENFALIAQAVASKKR